MISIESTESESSISAKRLNAIAKKYLSRSDISVINLKLIQQSLSQVIDTFSESDFGADIIRLARNNLEEVNEKITEYENSTNDSATYANINSVQVAPFSKISRIDLNTDVAFKQTVPNAETYHVKNSGERILSLLSDQKVSI